MPDFYKVTYPEIELSRDVSEEGEMMIFAKFITDNEACQFMDYNFNEFSDQGEKWFDFQMSGMLGFTVRLRPEYTTQVGIYTFTITSYIDGERYSARGTFEVTQDLDCLNLSLVEILDFEFDLPLPG